MNSKSIQFMERSLWYPIQLESLELFLEEILEFLRERRLDRAALPSFSPKAARLAEARPGGFPHVGRGAVHTCKLRDKTDIQVEWFFSLFFCELVCFLLLLCVVVGVGVGIRTHAIRIPCLLLEGQVVVDSRDAVRMAVVDSVRSRRTPWTIFGGMTTSRPTQGCGILFGEYLTRSTFSEGRIAEMILLQRLSVKFCPVLAFAVYFS